MKRPNSVLVSFEQAASGHAIVAGTAVVTQAIERAS